MCNLGDAKMVVGLPTTPKNLLCRRISTISSGSAPNQDKKTSLSLLLPRFRISTILQFDNNLGRTLQQKNLFTTCKKCC
jgi:hypothetical protein